MDVKKRLLDRKIVFAGWTSIGHPSITEIMARAGLDFIGIDIEHSTTSQEQSQRIIAASNSIGCASLPRIASHNMEMIKRLLDSGADGIIAPMVSKPEELERLIEWLKYPPVGKRSFGVARAQGYGFEFKEYVSAWNDSSMLIIQIESVEGVENVDKLLAYDEVDGVMIGPYDLSGSLNIPGQLDHPLVVEASKKVIDSCRRHGKACGTHLVDPDSNEVKKAIEVGYTFLVLSSDVFLLWKWSERMKNLVSEMKR